MTICTEELSRLSYNLLMQISIQNYHNLHKLHSPHHVLILNRRTTLQCTDNCQAIRWAYELPQILSSKLFLTERGEIEFIVSLWRRAGNWFLPHRWDDALKGGTHVGILAPAIYHQLKITLPCHRIASCCIIFRGNLRPLVTIHDSYDNLHRQLYLVSLSHCDCCRFARWACWVLWIPSPQSLSYILSSDDKFHTRTSSYVSCTQFCRQELSCCSNCVACQAHNCMIRWTRTSLSWDKQCHIQNHKYPWGSRNCVPHAKSSLHACWHWRCHGKVRMLSSLDCMLPRRWSVLLYFWDTWDTYLKVKSYLPWCFFFPGDLPSQKFPEQNAKGIHVRRGTMTAAN